ncbi:hypothetical protein ACEPAG_3693 [Sanghuangporus baumii]
MPSFCQKYIQGKGIPKTLTWSIYSASEDISYALSATSSDAIGLSAHIDKKGDLQFVAISINDRIIVFDVTKKKSDVLKRILAGESGCVAGFGIVRLVMYIKHSLAFDVRGYNLPPTGETSPGSAVRELLSPFSSSFEIDQIWEICNEGRSKKLELLCVRAWITQRLASCSEWSRRIAASRAADTSCLSVLEFKRLFSMVRELHSLDTAKLQTIQNDFTRIQYGKDGGVIIHNERYKTRVRTSKKTRVILTDVNGREYHGKANGVNGKKTFVSQGGVMSNVSIENVRVEGREESTHHERARDAFLLRVLQGVRILSDPNYPFIGFLWFPILRRLNVRRINNARIRIGQVDRPLNQSQANVMEAIINPHRPIVIAHGPPGTGKTTTISVAMREIHALQRTAWVVAQSNVGVKNIAESLAKHSVAFKILVSKEFYEEWHEHIYTEVEKHLIRTDEFPNTPREVNLLFHGTRIVLCTVSTLSNPALDTIRLFRLVPMQMLIIDEASQISVLDYLHLFGRFKELTKVCFFGDPKQLPPYGRDAAPTLQSIFDIGHLKSSAYFLDTQYRMPNEIGGFISRSVYQSKLKSTHPIDGWDCIKFIDVWNGNEEKAGKSWKNGREVQTILHLVRHYYSHKDYCIITPYDAQRGAIQNALKKERLPWENVFNVDSFQGNEAQYVLVSVVRTSGPGFLKSQNRVNVMLTRCKAGMVIVTKREFTRHDSVRKTLFGKLALHWEEKVGRSSTWCKWIDVAERKALLPGAIALHS